MGKIQFSGNALTVLKNRYLLKDIDGNIIETPDELVARVAKTIASIEKKKRSFWEDQFLEMMSQLRFLPNSPTLMNAGKDRGQLSACFVLPIEDSLDSIFDTLKFAAKIHQSGGGTGFGFSRIRPAGSRVRTTQGIASGPVSYIRIYDVATDTIKQGGARRGANMAVLSVDHPDIFEFIESKTDQKSITNFNISVGITDEFMMAYKARKEFWLKQPKSRKPIRKIDATVLFDRIVESAWKCGDPGLVFLDRMNLFNPTPLHGSFESTNPCGEQPLLPFESCNLGSLSLGTYVRGNDFDWKLFRQDIEAAVRFLDNVIDLNDYPVLECKKITLRNRKIGLGVMGFADFLLLKGISYASPEALQWGEKLMSFLDREAKRVSMMLASEKGPFPNWKGSLWHRLGYPALRNSTVSTVAPTGTISLLAGASSGIEPLFSGVFYRNVLNGQRLMEVHPAVEKLLKGKGISLESLNDDLIGRELGKAWSPSRNVPVETHVRMQSVFQRHSDSAVSKTINLPEQATVQDIQQAYEWAYDFGCKGITVYRDKSRSAQVLESAVPTVAENPKAAFCPEC